MFLRTRKPGFLGEVDFLGESYILGKHGFPRAFAINIRVLGWGEPLGFPREYILTPDIFGGKI